MPSKPRYQVVFQDDEPEPSQGILNRAVFARIEGPDGKDVPGYLGRGRNDLRATWALLADLPKHKALGIETISEHFDAIRRKIEELEAKANANS